MENGNTGLFSRVGPLRDFDGSVLEMLNWNDGGRPVIDKFKHLDIYVNVHPYVSTAVLLKDQSSQRELSREDLLKSLQEKNYVNANYIKSAF